MKKFLVSFLVVFGFLLFENAFALTVWTSYSKGSIVTTATSTGAHNNTVCCDTWHCGICHINHYTNGDYDVVPVCDCDSTFKRGTTPDGTKYKKTGGGSKSVTHSCGNKDGMQQQEIHCTWYYETWEPIKVTSPSPKPSPSSQVGSDLGPSPSSSSSSSSSPSPSPTCPHTNTHREGTHTHGHANEGQKATASSSPFYSKINTSENYRRNNPFNVGSDFSLSGRGHIAGSVKHDPVIKTWKCSGADWSVCDWCGAYMGNKVMCTTSGYYYDYNASTPKFTDTYHNVSMSFEGFKVNGSSSVYFSNLSSTYESRSQKTFSSNYFNERYVITALVSGELKEDDGKYGDSTSGGYLAKSNPLLNLGVLDVYSNIVASTSRTGGNRVEKSGLLYGYAYVKCDCGCIRDRYKIYFDLTPPVGDTSEEYTLTLRADGAPTTGGVKINNDGDYKDYTQKTSPIGDNFSISANANSGYEFDAWYKSDGNKYSEEKDRTVTMPGYNFTLIAKFKPLERYNVTVYSDGNGEVKFDGEYDDGQEGWEIYANVAKGDDIEIIAKPNENYVVDYWELVKEDENIGNDEKLTITDVQENYIIFVHFKPIDNQNDENYEQLVTRSWGPGIAIGGTDYAIPGKYYPIWAIANDGAEFYFWEHQKGNDISTKSKYGAEDIINMPDCKYVLTAWFQEDDETTYHDVIVEGDGNGDISINDEEPRPKDTTTVEDGTQITINAYPDDEFEFDKWTDEDGNVIPGGPELTVTIDEDKIYIAHFEYVGEGYKLKVESAGGGKVRGNVDDAIAERWYPIEAIPNENCEFLYWANKETGEITDYADYDYVKMPNEDMTLVAHFREIGQDDDKEQYYLTLKKQGSGTISGEGWYDPDDPVLIRAYPSSGYEFVGWYEDNLLVSDVALYPPITMPYYDMTLTAVFKPAGDDSEASPFKILSIRDVRWKDYFTGNGTTTNNELYVPSDATNNTVLVNSAKLIDNSYDNERDIVYGYAVEFELVTTGISKNQSNLSVIPTLYEKTSSERLNKININLGEYGNITSAESKDIKDFMITSEEKMISMPNSQTAPQVTWRWVWYLPLDIYEDICDKIGNNSDVVVNFEVYVNTVGGASAQRFDYVKVINYLNRSSWGGNVFTYRMDKTLLEDIYDNANN